MAAKDYIWDSQAAAQVEAQELDRHYTRNADHYDELAATVWRSLERIAGRPTYLKHGDLWDSLYPMLTRDSIMLAEFTRKNLPEPMARGGAKWAAWFTHYVVEKFLAKRGEERRDG